MNIADFKNKHSGERVFIIGNGPSLRDTPLDHLQNEHTIAMNRINLVFPSVDWRPSYFVYVRGPPPTEDRLKNYKETLSLDIPSFISSDNKEYFSTEHNIIYINKDSSVKKDECYEFNSTQDIIGSCWSRDIEEVVYRPGSSMYVAAQIASYMGFDEMYFVGCDGYQESSPEVGFRFPEVVFPSGNNPREYIGEGKIKFLLENHTPIRSLINGISFKLSKSRIRDLFVFDSGDDPNHFDKNYIKTKDRKSTIPEGKAKQRNYNLTHMHNTIEKVGEELGFETYNATVSKNIDIHEPVDFNDVVE